VTFVPQDLPSFNVRTHYPGLLSGAGTLLSVTDTSPSGAYYVVIVDKRGQAHLYRKVPTHLRLQSAPMVCCTTRSSTTTIPTGAVMSTIGAGLDNTMGDLWRRQRLFADGHDFHCCPMVIPWCRLLQIADGPGQSVPGAYPMRSRRAVIKSWTPGETSSGSGGPGTTSVSRLYGPVLNIHAWPGTRVDSCISHT